MERRKVAILVAMVALVGLGGFLLFQQQANTARAATATLPTTTITVGSLVATVSGAGNIYAPQQTNLSFQLTGVPITRVNVQVGDQVKAGEVLAQADDSDLQFALRTAQANLTSAQAALDKLKQPPLAPDVEAAKAQLASAQGQYNAAAAQNAHTGDQITVAKAALDKATVTLQQAQEAYNKVSWRPDIGMSSEAAALQQATLDYQSALANYNVARLDINDSAVQSAAQAVAQANANLVTVTAPATAQALAQAQASVDQAQVSVDQAKKTLDQAKIIAPFAGTVAAVNYVVGQLSPAGSSSPVITLVNMDKLETQLTLSEVDIPKVQIGQQVNLSFDALAGQTFPGQITSIAPVGTVTQGVVNYLVTASLTKPDAQIKPGMTATASIVVAERDNVVMVPNRAVRTQGNRHSITLLFEGKQIPVFVQTGLTNDQNTEIVSATGADGQTLSLQNGDVVLLNTTTTTRSGGLGGPGGGGIPFLGAFGGR